MEQSTNSKQKDTSPIQSNSEETNNLNSSKQTHIADPLEGTPFTIVNHPEKGWQLALGNQFITDPTASVQETIEKLETEKWFIVMRIAAILHQRIAQEAVKSMEEAMQEQKNQIKMDL